MAHGPQPVFVFTRVHYSLKYQPWTHILLEPLGMVIRVSPSFLNGLTGLIVFVQPTHAFSASGHEVLHTLSQGTRSGKTTESLPHGAAIFQKGIGDETCYLYLCLVLRCPSSSSYSCFDHLFKKPFLWGRGLPFARD